MKVDHVHANKLNKMYMRMVMQDFRGLRDFIVYMHRVDQTVLYNFEKEKKHYDELQERCETVERRWIKIKNSERRSGKDRRKIK